MEKIWKFLHQKIKDIFRAYKTLLTIITDISDKTAIYETVMALLIVLVLGLSFLDIFVIDNRRFSLYVETFDLAVCAIFAIDLSLRYRASTSKKSFFKKSWIEILAIIPFDVVFRAFRIVRIVRVAKITRASRIGRFVNTFTKVFRNIERLPMIAKMANPQYFRYKRFKKLLFGYGKSKSEDSPSKKE
ncbi:ion transporter [Tindallia californiensis]|uniref:Ion transport protein n=1 Tax=Tindallia californiensis TaxID=159292 RepID=A0A1H3LNM7_9FIRM|nr:ion transporter [Tindallia californiensis]SDY66032.1 Ion transport protein [Tindallia californiensis]